MLDSDLYVTTVWIFCVLSLWCYWCFPFSRWSWKQRQVALKDHCQARFVFASFSSQLIGYMYTSSQDLLGYTPLLFSLFIVKIKAKSSNFSQK